MTTNNSIIIFHRSKHNQEEDLINQKAFLEANKDIIGSAKIIDYMSSDYPDARKLFGSFDLSTKITVIMNSFLSRKDYDLQYNLYSYIRSFKAMGIVPISIYLMDTDGRLYKEMETIERL